MKDTFSVTVTEFHEDLENAIEQNTELEGVTEEEARTQAEDLMHAIRQEGNRGSTYRIDVHDVDEDGAYIYETLWAKKL